MLKNFILPGIGIDHELVKVNLAIIDEYKEHKSFFRSDCMIIGFYGNFPASKWAKTNTSAYSLPIRISRELMIEFKKIAESCNLSLYLDIANPLLVNNDTLAYYDNIILETLESDLNYVSVSCNLMKDYVKKIFPKYHIVLDEVSGYVGKEIDECSVSFRTVYASDKNMMKIAKKGSSILVIDSICADCYLYGVCTTTTGEQNKRYLNKEENRIENRDEHLKPCACCNFDMFMFENRKKNKTFLSYEALTKLSADGYSTFKFDSYPFYTISDYLDDVLYYLAVPECKYELKSMILHKTERNMVFKKYEDKNRIH